MKTLASSSVGLRILFFRVTIVHGVLVPTVVGAVLLVAAFFIPAWAVGHPVGTPAATFRTLDRSKRRWVGWMIALFVLGDVSGLLLAVYYLARIRPRLNAVAPPRRRGTMNVEEG
jgi:hypothetical protein